MTEHTPGPWSLPHFAKPDVNCQCKWVITEFHMGAVATIHVSGDGDDWQAHGDNPRFGEAVANAHLICAAPEMLDALYAAQAVLDDPELYSRFPLAPARIAILDAIKKAEGKE